MIKKKPNIAVLGAGITGLTAAWKLSQSGASVDLFESAPQVGGLAATYWKSGHGIDIGPHTFFTEDQEVHDFVQQLFPEGLAPLHRKVHLNFQSRHLDYPLNIINLLTNLKPSAVFYILRDLIFRFFSLTSKIALNPTLEETLRNNYGDYLFSHFFKPYTEQFWKIPCNELSPDAVPYNIRKGLFKTLQTFGARPKGTSSLEREKLPMQYPRKGFGEIADRLAIQCKTLGVKIHLPIHLEDLEHTKENQWLLTWNHGTSLQNQKYDAVVSTIPIPEFFAIWKEKIPDEIGKTATKLKYRPLQLMAIATTQSNILKGRQYVYFLDRPYNRLFETSQFSPDLNPQGENLLALELSPPSPQDHSLQTSEKISDDILRSLRTDIDLDLNKIKNCFTFEIPYAYPIYDYTYQKHLQKIKDFVAQYPSLEILGRSGEFRYMDSDRCIRRAFDRIPILLERLSKSS